MRIVSLLPSATEIVCALGLRESLVGRSHECDYPLDVADVPVMTYSTLGTPLCPDDPSFSAAEIDARVSAQAREGLSLYGLNMEALERAKPDLILTQELCDVCAVSYDTVNRAVRDLSAKWSGIAPQVISLEPTSIEEIFLSILTVGELTAHSEKARDFVNNLHFRVEKLQEMCKSVAHRPTVAALEWLNPPFAAGHWVPEQITLAGGRSALGKARKPSTRIEWDAVVRAQSEMVVIMPCGFNLRDSATHFASVAEREEWRDIPAPYLNQLYAVDATAYFSRPGPRVVDGAEILAGLIHPHRHAPPRADQAVRVQAFALDGRR